MRELIFCLTLLSFSTAFSKNMLTDEQALELGMTPVLESELKKESFNKENTFLFEDRFYDLAKITIVINKGIRSELNPQGQTMRVFQDGVFLHEFNTSTGTEKVKETTSGRKYIATTPVGVFRPKRAFKEYQSKAFFGANMDYAVFFNGGIAVHSTSKAAYARLGTRASGGCARLRYEDAQTVSEIVRSTGEGHSRMWDVGIEGLIRNQYSDRIKLPNLARYEGIMLDETSRLWTYDVAIIVVNN